MIMGDIYKIREFGYIQKAMDMLVARQNAVSSNIANISTPGYKAKRVNFENRMEAAMGRGIAMKETNPKHLPNGMKGIYGVKPAYSVRLSGARQDGNTVDLDKEFVTSSENSTKYNALVTVWKKHMRNIMSPLSQGR